MERTVEEIAVELRQAEFECKQRAATETAALGEMADKGLRDAQVVLAIEAEAKRVSDLCGELEAANARLNERWIAAHEALAFIRRSGSAS